MRIAVVNLTGGGFSGGYRKYLDTIIPLLRVHPRVSGLEVFGPTARRHDVLHLSPDVLFVPTARWSRFNGLPVVPMVRNMEPLTVPFGGNRPLEGMKNLARARAARKACEMGDRVIAVSDFVRRFLVDRWGIDNEKIGVVPHGVERPLEAVEARRPTALPSDIDAGFLFTAGSLRPARGLADAIGALSDLRRQGHRTRLVVAGASVPGSRGYERRMRRLARTCGVEKDVVWVGQLSSREMSWCFQHSEAFVTTSRAEACPNVLLEAMAHGCLCISTRQAPMTDILGQSGLYYVSGDRADLSDKVRTAAALAGPTRDDLRAAAAQRASEFDWRRTADQTVVQLEMAVR